MVVDALFRFRSLATLSQTDVGFVHIVEAEPHCAGHDVEALQHDMIVRHDVSHVFRPYRNLAVTKF